MSATTNTGEKSSLLSRFASIFGLLGAALLFCGWIYRWAYFSFFQIDVATIDLPIQSLWIVPLQVFFKIWGATSKMLLMLTLAVVVIVLTLWLLRKFGSVVNNKLRRSSTSNNLSAFLGEVAVVFWSFLFLLWLAQWQASEDAFRDARHSTSTLPAIALITPSDKIALGRQLNDVFTNPSLKGIGIIGDKGLFDALRGREDNDITNSEKPRAWRLLLNHGDWIYLFVGLPSDAQRDQRPLVVAAQRGGGQFLILSPEPSKL